MLQVTSRRVLRQSVAPALLGSLALGALTLVCYRLHLDFPVVGPLYLLAVVFQSLAGDFLAAALVSTLAAGCLDYFFVFPIFTLRIARPLDILALVSFLATALVITRLVSRVRAEARVARLQTDRMDHLYQLAQQLLGLEAEIAVGKKFLEPFEGVFGITAVCMFDAGTAELHLAGSPEEGLLERTRDGYVLGSDLDDVTHRITVRLLQAAGNITGAIGFESLQDPEMTAGPLTALAAVVLERTRAFRTANAAAAAAQTEIYRSAILDALAHEFKTPLATILAAAGGIREAGSLAEEQIEMTDAIEAETMRLGSLTSRLLRIARLDSEDVKPRVEITDVAALIEHVVEQYSRLPSDRRISFVSRGEAFEVPGDPELLRLAVSQLLDNACKYSMPGSAVTIGVEKQGHFVAVRVSNTGSSIAPAERNRIFDRFYRGTEVRSFTTGSGLGLYVARKIARAHGGDLDLDPQQRETEGVTFRLAIPKSKGEPDHVFAAH